MRSSLVFAVGLASCDVFGTLIDGWKYAQAVETDLEASTGMKPEVGFHWRNGRLESVTVLFPRLYEAKPLPEIAETVRHAVGNRFSIRRRHRAFVLAWKIGFGQNRAAVRNGLVQPERSYFRPAKFVCTVRQACVPGQCRNDRGVAAV